MSYDDDALAYQTFFGVPKTVRWAPDLRRHTPPTEEYPCNRCGGKGTIIKRLWRTRWMRRAKCPDCFGTGVNLDAAVRDVIRVKAELKSAKETIRQLDCWREDQEEDKSWGELGVDWVWKEYWDHE
jgi:hypothetical protein